MRAKEVDVVAESASSSLCVQGDIKSCGEADLRHMVVYTF